MPPRRTARLAGGDGGTATTVSRTQGLVAPDAVTVNGTRSGSRPQTKALELEQRPGRELRRGLQPPHFGSKPCATLRCASASSASVSGSGDGRSLVPERTCSARGCDRSAPRRRAGRATLRDRQQHLPEGRQPVPRLGREVRAAEEGLAVGRQEHGHRQLPWPVGATTASSRSSRGWAAPRGPPTPTKRSFITRAVCASSNDSRSITWHQW